ncbi:MAG: hypothetical protein AAF402_01585 [Pseudomonadota bacterium]
MNKLNATESLRSYWLVAAAVVLIAPGASMIFSGFLEGMDVTSLTKAVADQYVVKKGNLLITSALGLLPLLLLTLVMWVVGKFVRSVHYRRSMFFGGVTAIVLIIVWANTTHWRSYLPDKQFLSWPHGIELVIGPLIFAPIAMLLGVLAGWLTSRYF